MSEMPILHLQLRMGYAVVKLNMAPGLYWNVPNHINCRMNIAARQHVGIVYTKHITLFSAERRDYLGSKHSCGAIYLSNMYNILKLRKSHKI